MFTCPSETGVKVKVVEGGSNYDSRSVDDQQNQQQPKQQLPPLALNSLYSMMVAMSPHRGSLSALTTPFSCDNQQHQRLVVSEAYNDDQQGGSTVVRGIVPCC